METKEFSAICATLALFRCIVVDKKSYNPSVKEFDMKNSMAQCHTVSSSILS